MSLPELIQDVSKSTQVEEKMVRRIVRTVFDLLGKEVSENERVNVPQLGSFIKKDTTGGERILFKPAAIDQSASA